MSLLKEIIDEFLGINEEKNYVILNEEPVIEMARINTKEFYGLFPYNKFDIRIWSNDHNPPHFHVIAEDWEIIVSIETGKILKVKHIGKSSKVYSYIEEHIQEWLNSPCMINKKFTNGENALIVWEANNG